MIIKNRNRFRITRFIILKLPGLLKFFSKFRTPRKRLLIIKTDAIGDYVLFRNFIEVLKKSEAFKDYPIDLFGNELWQDLAVKYDSPFIDHFFFISPGDLYESPLKILKLGWQLYRRNYETVLQPTFARTFINDGLAGLTAAKKIIGFEGDAERINIKYKTKTDRFYTRRLLLPTNIRFEFERSRVFFESVLNEVLSISGPSMPLESGKRQGIVIFPGSGVFKRSWEAEKFLALIKLILLNTPQRVILAGGNDETQTGGYLTGNLPPGSVDNLIGKTSLIQLVELIGNAALVIANETSAVHIAAATQTKAICILGGGHFGRFAPYPEQVKSKQQGVYEKMDCYNCNWNCIYKTNENVPFPCISNLIIEKVWLATQLLLPQNE